MLDSCGLLTKGSNNLIPYAMDFYYRRDDAEERQFANRFQRTFVRTCNPYLIGVWDTVASVGWLWWRRYFRNATLARSVPFAYQALAVDVRRAHYRPSRWNEDAKPDGQTIEQVWFPGYHGAVGGQMADNRISDIPSMWVLASAEERGLRLKTSWEAGLNPDPVLASINRSDRHLLRFRARARVIPEESKIHKSVTRRMDAPHSNYQPLNLPKSFEVVD